MSAYLTTLRCGKIGGLVPRKGTVPLNNWLGEPVGPTEGTEEGDTPNP